MLAAINSYMFNFKERPYNLLLLTAIVILIASFFVSHEKVDFHLHDTYFIIALAHLFWGTSGLLLILWTLYIFTQRFLFFKFLMWTHVILTIITLVLLVAISFYSNHYYEGLAGMPRRYYDYGSWDTFLLYNNLTKAVLITFLIIGLGLLAFIINLIFGLFKNLKRLNSR